MRVPILQKVQQLYLKGQAAQEEEDDSINEADHVDFSMCASQGARRFLSGCAGTGTGTVSGCRNCRNLPELPVLGGCNRRFSLLATHQRLLDTPVAAYTLH
jgi:hypothetical protein